MNNKNEFKYIEMKQSDIRILKEKIWLENNKKCPVLNKEIPLEKHANPFPSNPEKIPDRFFSVYHISLTK